MNIDEAVHIVMVDRGAAQDRFDRLSDAAIVVAKMLKERSERWYASNRRIRELEDKLTRVEALPAKWRHKTAGYSTWDDAADELEAALKGSP